MPSKIRVLDEHTINKIAAGEVIESPASVVKELVENSIDAGSTEICVEIKGGGRQLIRITDNGCGMNRDDALLCLERHATSKIKAVEDIESIFSMGFRGEAVPSIASISKFTLLTSPQDEGEGTLLIVEGGKVLQCGTAVRSPGTTIEVKSLFFNVPVRRKFQKSPTYDANEILKVMNLLALGHPHIKFQLIDNQKTEIQTGAPSTVDFPVQLKERIANIMGSEFAAGCCWVDRTSDEYTLQGYIGLPAYARQNRTGQYLFINNRAVFSPLVSYVVRESYGMSLPSNKHPIFVLHLRVPGEVVDVNVHPQKREVRLRQDGIIRELVLKAVQAALQQGSKECHPIYQPVFELAKEEEISIPKPAFVAPKVQPVFSQEKMEKEIMKDYQPRSHVFTPSPKPLEQPSLNISPVQEKRVFPRVLTTISDYIILDSFSLEPWKSTPPGALCLVDQKAAHARVIFEHLVEHHGGQLAIQTLLIPHSLQVTPYEASLLREHLDKFIGMGIHIHESGPHSFMIDALPAIFGNLDITKLVTDLLTSMHEFLEENALEKKIEKRIAQAASYATVSGRKRLQFEEAQSLINQLFTTQSPFLSPQGNSTLAFITPEEIYKKFQHMGNR